MPLRNKIFLTAGFLLLVALASLYLIPGLTPAKGISILIIIAAVGILHIVSLEKVILKPLSRLCREVSDIGDSRDLSGRIRWSGSGELADLTRAINGMLEELERSQAEQQKSEVRYREVVEDHSELKALHEKLQKEIEERERAAREAREAHRELENLIEASQDPIIVCDDSGRITKTNQAFHKMLGFPPEEVLGRMVYSFSILKEGSYESTTGEAVSIDENFFQDQSEQVARFLREKKTSNWFAYYINRSRKIIPVMQSIIFLHNDRGEHTGTFGIIRDITEQRKTELELIRAKEAAEEANRSKSSFLANMSHEIRTPLNGVIGFTDMLLEARLEPEYEDYARTIKRSGEALLAVINDILDVSKIEAGKIEFESIGFDLEMLAYEVCEMIRPRTDRKGVQLIFNAGGHLPSDIMGDPHRFRQVLVNLMENAAKFTHEGSISLHMDQMAEKDGLVMIHTKVADTGIGIPENMLDSIFDTFRQADDTTTRRYGGTGLGLSICRRIAKLMGGNVWAESEERGSTFHFTAWLARAEAKAVQHSAPPSPDRHEANPLSAGTRPAVSVLLAEDNPINQKLVEKLLTRAGCTVEVAGDGREAVDLFRAFPDKYDIVLMDVQMPVMNGLDAARVIRIWEEKSARQENAEPGAGSLARSGSRIPIVAITANAMKGDREKCLGAGMDDYIAKPLRQETMFRVLNQWVPAHGAAREPNSRESEILAGPN